LKIAPRYCTVYTVQCTVVTNIADSAGMQYSGVILSLAYL